MVAKVHRVAPGWLVAGVSRTACGIALAESRAVPAYVVAVLATRQGWSVDVSPDPKATTCQRCKRAPDGRL